MYNNFVNFVKKIKNFINKNKILVVVFLLFIFILIPVFANDIYVHPVGDDYAGANQINNFMNGDTTKLLSAGINRTIDTYKTWQGNYFTTFLGIFNPLLVSTKYYSLFILISQIFYIFSVMFCFLSLPKIKKIMSKKQAAGLGAIYLILSLLFMYSAGEGIYWYASIMMYLLSYSFSMILLGLIIRHIVSKKKALYWLIIIGAICLAGTSYVTCIFMWFVLLGILIVSFFKNRKIFWLYLPTFILFSVGFAANVLAPGNFVRKTYTDQQVSAIRAIWLTIPSALSMVWRTTSKTILVPVLIILTPACIKIINNVKYGFKYPIIISFFLLASFAMLFAPCTYAYGTYYQPLRVENIQLFYLLILLPALYFYWLGNYIKKYKIQKNSRDLEPVFYIVGVVSVFLMITSVGTNGLVAKSISTDLIYSKSANYDACMDTTETILSSNKKIVSIENCLPTENMFNFTIQTDDWAAKSLEVYYKKDVTVITN